MSIALFTLKFITIIKRAYASSNVYATNGELNATTATFYYNGTELYSHALNYDASKELKLYIKTYESAFDFDSLTITQE